MRVSQVTDSGRDHLAAIVLAGGSGSRFGANKLVASLEGRPVLAWSLAAMEASELVSFVVLVASPSFLEASDRLVRSGGFLKVRAICSGGSRRQDSVFNGLRAAASATWVLIHDGARPFVDPAMIQRGVAAAARYGAAIAAVRVNDTIKVVSPNGIITATPDRAVLWAAQTPQIFQTHQLLGAYEANDGLDVTDDAALLERSGYPVGIFEGSYSNVKITTIEDLTLAQALARERVLRFGSPS